jgi:hypothetical protein
MTVPMVVGALLCLASGLWPAEAVRFVSFPIAALAATALPAPEVSASLAMISRIAFLLLGLVGLTAYVRYRLLRGREIRSAETWGCAYDAPSHRMQYTASSFAQPLLASLGTVLKQSRRLTSPQGHFPTSGHFTEHLTDRSLEEFWLPSAARTVALFRRLKFLQQGRLQSYLLYILITLIGLLLWKVR